MSRRRSFSLVGLALFYCTISLLVGLEAAAAIFISASLWSLVFRGHLHLFSVLSQQLGELGKWISTSSQESFRR